MTKHKKTSLPLLTILLTATVIFASFGMVRAEAKNINVPKDYPTLDAAEAHASVGDLILLSKTMPSDYSADLPVEDKALFFLRDVFQIDMAKYSASQKIQVFPPDFVSPTTSTLIGYRLESLTTSFGAMFTFNNAKYETCYIERINGTITYTQQQPTEIVDVARAFLDRYANFTGSTYIQALRGTLDYVNLTKENLQQAIGNTQLYTVSVDHGKVYAEIGWSKLANGISIPGTTISLQFINGSLASFIDMGNNIKVGSSTVTVSKEQAIQIAKEQSKNLSWTVGLDSSNSTEIKDFKVLNSPVQAQLGMNIRGDYAYPYWRVDLYLDKVYPGGVSSIAVGIWADTGDVIYCQELNYGAGAPQTPSPSPSISPTITPALTPTPTGNVTLTPQPILSFEPTSIGNSISQNNNVLFWAGVATTVMATGALAILLILKLKGKRQ